jgi:neutral trehalase
MDDGVRFLPQFAHGVTNKSSNIRTLGFWSIDLNGYLYREKRTLAAIATELGNDTTAKEWTADADALLPRLQKMFYLPDSGGNGDNGRSGGGGGGGGGGYFQDVFFNGTFLPIQGCEGYTALFAQVATPAQAQAVAVTLSDPKKFLLNFSLPTVSMANPYYKEKGYWKGPTWLDQTWFAYTGLKEYGEKQRAREQAQSQHQQHQHQHQQHQHHQHQQHQHQRSGAKSGVDMIALADKIKSRVFAVGQGFGANDTTPLNEHYDAQTGKPIGTQHFSWTAAHVLMWAQELRA